MTTQMNLFTKGDFKVMYERLRSDKGMMTVLSNMQIVYGINDRKAYENADAIIRMVASHENAASMLSDDAQGVLNEFLNESASMSGYDRKILLHQLYFGLKIYQDDELMEKVKEGSTESDLFHEYYKRCGEDPTITETMLQEKISEMMGNYRLSPMAMRYIVEQMEKSQNLRATASAIGEDGLRFKAFVAMNLYLRNKDTLTMEEAVHIACTNVELQAVADGVSRGLITEERAKRVFAVVALMGLLACAVLALHTPGTHTLYALLFGTLGFAAISDDLAEWLGKVAAKHTFVRTVKEADTAAAMEEMIARMEAEAAEIVNDEAEAREKQVGIQQQTANVYA